MIQSNVEGFQVKRGKVRDVYDIGNELVIVTTDRLSAFDCILPTPIPRRGVLLNQVSKFWFDFISGQMRRPYRHHMLSTDLKDMPTAFQKPEFEGRSMLVRKLKPYPVECVMRGYLSGSGWTDYKQTGKVCGVSLPPGLQESMPLTPAIFTPATKAEVGHDENITFNQMQQICENAFGTDLAAARWLKTISEEIFSEASNYAFQRGIIIADTKFEFGRSGHQMMIMDEVLTPDSSRYWMVEDYCIGKCPPSLDKQYVRNYLNTCGWDKKGPPPELPPEVVEGTLNRYMELYERLIGRKFDATA